MQLKGVEKNMARTCGFNADSGYQGMKPSALGAFQDGIDNPPFPDLDRVLPQRIKQTPVVVPSSPSGVCGSAWLQWPQSA